MSRFWGWLFDHLRRRGRGHFCPFEGGLELCSRSVVSMVEVPGSGTGWSPGGGYWSHPGYDLEIEFIKAGVGLTRTGALWHLVHIPAHILARNPFLDMSRYEGVDSFEITGLDFLSPGGGGPGQSLTSTNPPPTVEEVGRLVTSGGRSRKRCPSGYRWNGRRCVRKD